MDRKLSVIKLHSTDVGGGAERHALLSHRAIRALGHRCQLLVAAKKSDSVDIDEIRTSKGAPGLRRLAHQVETMTGLQYLYAPSFRRVSSQFKFHPDVVHIHSLHSGGTGWSDLTGVSSLLAKYPVVFSLHDLWLLTGHCFHGVDCERWKIGCGCCPHLDRYPAVSRDATKLNWRRKKRLFRSGFAWFIAGSEWARQQAEQSPIIGRCPVEIVPNPIDLGVFKPGDRALARRILGVPNGKKTVLLAATQLDNPLKGMYEAIAAVNALSHEDTFVLLVGKNSDEVLAKLKVPGKSLGYLENPLEMAECYLATDVFLMPSKIETFGNAAAEATSCGASVVSFHAGALREVVNSIKGISVADGDVARMVDAVQLLLSDNAARHDRVRRGAEIVFECYSPEKHAAGCLRVYRNAIEAFRQQLGKCDE